MNLEHCLSKLLNNLEYNIVCGSIDGVEINNLVYDSRQVENGDLFICLSGARFDSHSEISNVISKIKKK